MDERTKHTMRDVARLAGVSTSTVSAVINGSVPVSPERKKRVLQAMSSLNYHPDEVARSLKTGRTNVIGIVIPDITNTFYPEIIRAVENAGRRAGYSVVLCDSNEDPANEERHLVTLSSRRVDGVILACCANSTAYATSIRHNFPLVFIDRIPPTATEGTVTTDNTQAGYMASRHLIQLGHERIAMLAGHMGLSPHHDRLEGFRKAMQESHIPIRDEYLVTGGVQIEDGLEATRRLLALSLSPTAIMASNNKLLLGALEALVERKISVPSEISLIGFDDYIWNRYFSPSVTSVAQATDEMGTRAFELLLQIIARDKDEKLPQKHIRIPAELRLRHSTAPPST